jgi:hypothetical protein
MLEQEGGLHLGDMVESICGGMHVIGAGALNQASFQ